MNNLSIKDTMSSREIAQIAGKNHKEVLRSIRNMERGWVKVSGRNFALAEYLDEQGKPRPQYELTKTECLYIATTCTPGAFNIRKMLEACEEYP
ncbi:Rha family transcriptional regulator, partial [Ornithobacterium rhinotracheale]